MAADLGKILIVEDDPNYEYFLKQWIGDAGYHWEVVRDMDGAVGYVSQHRTPPTAVVIDLRVRRNAENPDAYHGAKLGLELRRNIRKKWPECPIILASNAPLDEIDLIEGDAHTSFLIKSEHRNGFLHQLSRLLKVQLRRPTMFIVHGHDDAAKRELVAYLRDELQLGEPTVLQEEAAGGRTIVEKFEEHAKIADLVFVLLTPDDTCVAQKSGEQTSRARQNVIFELGYFLGLLKRNRGRVIMLVKRPLEIPSDLAGLEMIDISNGVAAANEKIRRELEKDWL